MGEEEGHCRIGKVTPKSNVHTFPGVSFINAPRDEQPIQHLIEGLELLLEEARAGTIRAVGVAAVLSGHATDVFWHRGENESGHDLGAAIADLAFVYAHDRFDLRQSRTESSDQ